MLNVGMACQFQNHNDPSAHVAVKDLQPYIQDCLDLIEFANGDVNTTWGKKRAEMGGPRGRAFLSRRALVPLSRSAL